jgi:hypothetical protein
MYRQYDLTQKQARMTVWLESAKTLPEGTLLTLARPLTVAARPPEGWWRVARVGKVALYEPPDTRWRVGGLV